MGRLAAVPELVRKSDRDRLAERYPPRWWEPMNATLTDRRFSDPGWPFERKLDGERCLGYRTSGQVWLFTRNQLDAGGHYPEVVEELADQTEGRLRRGRRAAPSAVRGPARRQAAPATWPGRAPSAST